MKLRLRTLITSSKTVEHAKYNLSCQLTADAMGYLQPVAADAEQPGRRWFTAEAYILNGADWQQLSELVNEPAGAFPAGSNIISQILQVIGISAHEEHTILEETTGWES